MKLNNLRYSISQEICTRFCCALLYCGYAIVHNEFTLSIYPYSSGLLCWHWGNLTGAIVRLPQCQWRKPDGYGKISQCITTTKHGKAKIVCIFLGIYCMYNHETSICRICCITETVGSNNFAILPLWLESRLKNTFQIFNQISMLCGYALNASLKSWPLQFRQS